MTHVLLAHAPEAEARAQAMAAKLGAMGIDVRRRSRAPGTMERRRLAAAIDAAACVLVLSPRPDPALHAAARRARAAGKLARWSGREDARTNGRAWRRLAASVTVLTGPKPAPTPMRAQKPGYPNAALVLGFFVIYATLVAGAYYLLP